MKDLPGDASGHVTEREEYNLVTCQWVILHCFCKLKKKWQSECRQ